MMATLKNLERHTWNPETDRITKENDHIRSSDGIVKKILDLSIISESTTITGKKKEDNRSSKGHKRAIRKRNKTEKAQHLPEEINKTQTSYILSQPMPRFLNSCYGGIAISVFGHFRKNKNEQLIWRPLLLLNKCN